MQERRNKRLAALLIFLLGITAFVFWFGKEDTGHSVDPAIFKQYDLGTIDEIALESPSEKIVLKYEGARWKVNGTFNANSQMIEVLFATLQQAEAKRPVAMSARDSIAGILKQRGVKVSLSSAGETKAVFFAGGNQSKSQSYFLQENGTVPYVVTIPGYRVYVSGIFELSQTDWRDKYIFGFNWRNFQRLKTTFPKNPSSDFEIEMDDGLPVMKGMQEVDTTKLNNFLDDVSLLTADDFSRSNPPSDSLVKIVPLVTFSVSDVAGRTYDLQLYPLSDKSIHYSGLINGTQWARFHKKKISPILSGRSSFQKPR